MDNTLRVGIEQKDFCYIGYLDVVNKVPTADNIKCVYVDLTNNNWVVAMESELIFLNREQKAQVSDTSKAQ